MGDSGVALQRLPSERYWSYPPVCRHPRRLMAALIPPGLQPTETSPGSMAC